MPGKYSSLKGQLTKFSGEDGYQERVNRKKDSIKDQLRSADYPINIHSLGRILVEARQEKSRLEELVKEQNLIIAAMEQELVELMEGEDFSSVKLSNDVSIYIKDDVYVTVKNKEEFHNWVRETDQEDLLTVNYQTMSALVKNRLIESEPIPPGVSAYFKQSISVRGAKNVEF